MTEDTNITPDVEQIAMDGFEPFIELSDGVTDEAELEEQEKNDPLYILTHRPKTPTKEMIKDLALGYSIFFSATRSFFIDPDVIKTRPQYKAIDTNLLDRLDQIVIELRNIASATDITDTVLEQYNNLEDEAFSILSVIDPDQTVSQRDIAQLFSSNDFLPMYNTAPANALMQMGKRRIQKADRFSAIATFKNADGTILEATNLEQLVSNLGVPAKKLYDASIASLASRNYHRTTHVDPYSYIDLIDFWKAQDKPVIPEDDSPEERKRVDNLIKTLKKQIKLELLSLRTIEIKGFTGQKTVNGEDHFRYFIAGFDFLSNNILRIEFLNSVATFIVHSYLMQLPTSLLRLNNNNPNDYPIARAIAYHNSIDNNAAVGTDKTLSVASLLKEAPEIPTYEELVATNNRNWKRRIKDVLEKVLDNLVQVNYLSSWTYRNPYTKKTYSPEAASSLLWDEYYKLMVDFTFVKEPDQEERRSKRAAAKAEAAQKATEKPKRKRGRPRKNPAPQPD